MLFKSPIRERGGMMSKKTFFSFIILILMLFFLALFPVCSGTAKGDTEKEAKGSGAVEKADAGEAPVQSFQTVRSRDRKTRPAPTPVSRSYEEKRALYKKIGTFAQDGSPEAIDELIGVLQDDGDTNMRNAALSALERTAAERLLEVAQIASLDDDYSIRSRAIQLLAKIDSPEAFALITGALEDTNPVVQGAAINRLKEKPTPGAVAALIRFLEDTSKNINPRREAVRALEKAAGSPNARQALIHILVSESDSAISMEAAWILRLFKTSEVENALIQTVKNHKNGSVRRTACSALAEFGSPRVTDVFFGALQDEDRLVRDKAVWLLGEQAKKDSLFAQRFIEAMVAHYDEETDFTVRNSITTILHNLNTPEAREALENIRNK